MSIIATGRYTPRGDAGQFVKAKIVPGIMDAVRASVAAIAEEARAIVPVDTGELRDSIDSRVDDTGTSVYGSVFATAPHAGYVEFGTGVRGMESPGAGPYPYNPKWPGMPAQPYLRPAQDTCRPQIKSAFLTMGGAYIGGK